MDLTESRNFVLQQARANITKVGENPGYVEQAKQINASLASIVAMERNAVMLEAIHLRNKEGQSLELNEGV